MADRQRFHDKFWKGIIPVIKPFIAGKFNATNEELYVDGPCIIISNHVTDWDPLMVGLCCQDQAYFVASEHITRFSLFGLIKWVFDPIIRFKGTVGAITVKDILRKTRDGKNVVLFPEGVRTMDGVTMPILPSTGKLIKRSGAAMVTYRLQGGYFSSPNWSENGIRRTKMTGGPVHVVSSEEIKNMSVDEINEMINQDLHVDAYEEQAKSPVAYKGKDLAENLENILFICPECKKLNTMRSKGDTVKCSQCGYESTYDVFGKLTGKFDSVRDWAAWQRSETAAKAALGEKVQATGKLYTIKDRIKQMVVSGDILLDGESLKVCDKELSLSEIPDMEIHGRHELVFTVGHDYYEISVDKPYSACSFLWFYNAYKA